MVMKRLLLIAAMFTVLAAAAQRNPAVPTTTDNIGAQVPPFISTRFNSDYPNMHAVWTLEGENFRADFTEGTLDRSVTYNKNGRLLQREEELAKDNYPLAIGTYCSQHYPKEQYAVWSRYDSTGALSYYISRDTETLWFDKSGKYKMRSKMVAHTRLEPTDY